MGTLADVFILVTGNSEVHMKTLVDGAQDALERNGHAVRVEGENSSNWRLLDAGDVAVHVFSRKGRDFYKLEKLWGDAEILSYEYKE
jgi:ribosome-associated protein